MPPRMGRRFRDEPAVVPGLPWPRRG